ncbi:cob(I)yrinic acid a,c-diamide adenosyltransferase [Desulfospira joergensenii]|uniref:cob(I)yrinic acid a,c-diamide adenosyltransferase n=1 Tax=Desulfospira joergensenii TaxID=53329 RepID=UPI0003B772E9|nr:cob(I)yrinic acid a,c-diamide adenosyltransferase [Desulfospira joergensenii]
MSIYTGRGDDGTTGLLSDERVPKNHERIDAFGDIDELNATLGVLKSSLADDAVESTRQISRIQSDMLKIGAYLSAWRDAPILERLEKIDDTDIRFMETAIDSMEVGLPPLNGFLVYGGHPCAAWSNFARAVCRRAERKVVGLSIELKVGRSPRHMKYILVYLNRLSDYLFLLGRKFNCLTGLPEDIWKS